MAIRVICLDDYPGVVILDSVTEMPLPLAVNWFDDDEEARGFLDWLELACGRKKLTDLSAAQLESYAEEWSTSDAREQWAQENG